MNETQDSTKELTEFWDTGVKEFINFFNAVAILVSPELSTLWMARETMLQRRDLYLKAHARWLACQGPRPTAAPMPTAYKNLLERARLAVEAMTPEQRAEHARRAGEVADTPVTKQRSPATADQNTCKCAAIMAADSSRHFTGCPLRDGESPAPIPMLLHCPLCSAKHIDRGEFATKSHHTHACQHCGHVWMPAIVPTVGVQFLPGFKDNSP